MFSTNTYQTAVANQLTSQLAVVPLTQDNMVNALANYFAVAPLDQWQSDLDRFNEDGEAMAAAITSGFLAFGRYGASGIFDISDSYAESFGAGGYMNSQLTAIVGKHMQAGERAAADTAFVEFMTGDGTIADAVIGLGASRR